MFIDELLKYKSLSIVGLEKNTGKTECLNYVLKTIKDKPITTAITSIGIDGEGIDQVTQTKKPEITVYEGMFFVTSEKHYRQRKLISEIYDVTDFNTSLGRLIVARAVQTGKVQISGPADTVSVKKIIKLLSEQHDIDFSIIDGALSRLSPASPAVTEAMILATGAAVSVNLNTLIKQTKFTTDIIDLPNVNKKLYDELYDLDEGIYAVIDYNTYDGSYQSIKKLKIKSLFSVDKNYSELLKYGTTIYISGALNDKVLNMFRVQKNIEDMTIIIRDFTKVFTKPETYYSYIKKGGKLLVLDKAELVAVTVNPLAPSGYCFDSDMLISKIRENISIPVYDVLKQ